ncbi:hypothetical protein JCM18903_2271 [Psychrobacter sp. JCM 18903]|uniref:hypothetical protein n=1 Tax=Psychrobacter sp. JCM 18903 TaxID=1298610 RepID=UPI0004350300|nr:hypothetical protein [Psychrobacter sp. JCM 18903]GAF62210.1 hypothetical protein JCM18903_2271 [Psychrobacter sp. JCM 18903]
MSYTPLSNNKDALPSHAAQDIYDLALSVEKKQKPVEKLHRQWSKNCQSCRYLGWDCQNRWEDGKAILWKH